MGRDLPSPGKRLIDQLPQRQRLALTAAPYPSLQTWVDDCVEAAADELLGSCGGPVWTEDGFAKLLASVRRQYAECVLRIGRDSADLMSEWVMVARKIEAVTGAKFAPAVADMRSQMRRLVYPGCLVGFGSSKIADVRRYVSGIEHRLTKLPNNAERDRGQMQRCREVDTLIDRSAAAGADALAIETATWLAEELRISVFAQHLGTPEPVSEKRIQRALAGAP